MFYSIVEMFHSIVEMFYSIVEMFYSIVEIFYSTDVLFYSGISEMFYRVDWCSRGDGKPKEEFNFIFPDVFHILYKVFIF
jgi:hypothetical protein